ncbi:hypothetical protein QUC28_29030, partial [Klebsiella oxytoca]|nr:hypothetical protein [Klebsiella oxytoca]MDM4132293.1 hypothetical protein [Klebsiella oxytoca]MDM4181295.1 hypothetical protein [Klebsiella oxytoca]MDM4199361.1 hypothetical protein [Klebsiella oxytoca]MDM4287398.1 hypothetical protein [Klebsiella oxytoca]
MADNEKLGSTSPQILLKNATNLDKLVNGRESESLPDRFAVLRRTWYGMEMIFNRFITYITGRGEQAVGAIGWQELGNWATGLTVDNRQQIVYYNGSWYKYLGELEHLITGDSPENDGGVWSAENPTGKWSNIGDAALRSNLGSDEEGMGTCLITHVQDGVVTQNLHDFLNSSINFVTPQMFSSFQEAATFASENKVKLHIGPYQYDINEPIEVWGSLCIEGDGEDFSKLIQKAGATGDAVIIQHLQDVNDTFQFSGFSVETEKRFSVKNTAIIVDGTALIPSPGGQIPRRTKGRGIFRNLRVCGTAENRSENIGFGVHFDLRSLGWYDMESINVTGCAELGTEYKLLGIGLLQRGGGWPVEINQSRLRFYNLEYAWYCPDYVEGLFLDKYQFVNVRNGIVGGV